MLQHKGRLATAAKGSSHKKATQTDRLATEISLQEVPEGYFTQEIPKKFWRIYSAKNCQSVELDTLLRKELPERRKGRKGGLLHPRGSKVIGQDHVSTGSPNGTAATGRRAASVISDNRRTHVLLTVKHG